MTTDERELMRRFGAGERDGFDAVYDQYAHRVLGFAMRLTGNRSDAEDLVQETFVSAFKGCSTFQGRASILTWLLGIAVRRWRDQRRRPGLDTVELNDDWDTDENAPCTDSVEGAVINSVVVADALSRLAPPFREALLLVASQGLTYREAADVLGEPVGTVKWRVFEATRRLRRILGRSEGEEHELQSTERRGNPAAADRRAWTD
jgi:RNA polymerase sigma-70 factor (ECF subfamily)